MAEIIVDQGQSLLDVAIQHCGDVSAVLDIAVLNDLSITDKLTPGTKLLIPMPVDAGLVQYFANNNFIPATAAVELTEEEAPSGIAYWGIGIDFIVS